MCGRERKRVSEREREREREKQTDGHRRGESDPEIKK